MLIVGFLILYIMNTNAQNTDYLQMVSYAVKAPSGHNTQPWLFELQSDKIIISPNFEKTLPAVDANNRELFMSLGCATENLCLAASALQYHTKVEVDSTGNILVYLEKSAKIASNPLFEQIEKRQTNRSKYNRTKIPEETISNILQQTQTTENKIYAWGKNTTEFDLLTDFVLQGNLLQMNDKAFKEELLSWIRFNKKHAENTNDGISYAVMGAPNLPKPITKFFVKLALKAKTQNKTDLKNINSSSHLLLLTSQENDIASWIETGRILQRLLLTLTQNDIAVAYLNQPCEEEKLNEKMQTQLPIDRQKPQILLRIGYAKSMPYSKRKKLMEVLK